MLFFVSLAGEDSRFEPHFDAGLVVHAAQSGMKKRVMHDFLSIFLVIDLVDRHLLVNEAKLGAAGKRRVGLGIANCKQTAENTCVENLYEVYCM